MPSLPSTDDYRCSPLKAALPKAFNVSGPRRRRCAAASSPP